ncbi:IniB N-terminal domain-containing protein [Pseudonocardia sp. N23]|uniref:IniB N-terminal domain-containing protein n=1 Tax=Pseudonocardia sp. N23 TaxID=1987376 RepID=UPI000BFCA9A1|nr:IniB N-terminal domain-containing protein [Pseudonocardia sp. N23]GAY10451.1 Dentin sialophosphoprotein precursor [Pseudonocardia sp. N23]
MSTSLLDFLMSLLNDPAEQAAFQADPAAYLQSCGLSDLSADDIHDAIALANDDESHNWKGGHDHGSHLPPPPPVHHGHESPHEAAVKYLNNYITNNYVSVDARETNIDNSVHQDIDASHGGHVFAPVDVTNVNATGDHSAAVGGANNGNIATGDGAVAGTGNSVAEGNTDSAVNFGAGGSATNNHGATASDGGVIGSGTGGDHTDSHDALTNFGSGSVANDGGNASQTNSNNHTDASTHTDSGHNTSTVDNHSTTDAHNVTDSNNDLFSHNDATLTDDHSIDQHTHTEDSHDTTVDHHSGVVDIPLV